MSPGSFLIGNDSVTNTQMYAALQNSDAGWFFFGIMVMRIPYEAAERRFYVKAAS